MRLPSNMDYLSGHNPLKGTARGDSAFILIGRAVFRGHVKKGRGWVSKSSMVRPLRGQPQSRHDLPTYLFFG